MIELFLETPVAWVIFVLTIAVSLLAFSNDSIYHKFMLHPYSVTRGEGAYTVVTSGFIHKDWMHLFFNMWSFYIFAFILEKYIGHWQFAVLYMVCLLFSDLPTIAKHKNDYGYRSLGASGAISGVVFSFILFEPLTKIGIMFIPIGIPAFIFGILYLFYCWYASKQSRDQINHDAHFFGALCGIMVTIILYHPIVPHFLNQLGLH